MSGAVTLAPRWLLRRLADVPDDDSWLSDGERVVHAGLRVPKRRADWRLGRWTAKAAVASALGVDPRRVSVLADADGAPEAMLDGEPLAMSLSISHRAGVGLAVVGDGAVVGGDLELIEPRSDAFVREWFAPHERAMMAAAGAEGRPDEVACLIWSIKEATAKVRREGLRLDVRDALVSFCDDGDGSGGWRRSAVDWGDGGGVISGWWRVAAPLVIAIAGAPACPPPIELC